MNKLNQNGAAHLLFLLASLGFILFLAISNTFDFRDRLFGNLFPKPESKAATGKVWLQNNNTSVGFSLDWGGSLTDFLYTGQEIVNRHDDGREIQVAFYDGSQQYDNCAGCTGVFGWDPVQGGDRYNHGSQVVVYTATANQIYTKAIANQWYPDDKGGGANQEVPSDTIIEQWVSVEPYPDTFKLHYKVTHTGSDNHARTNQEFPATYVNLDVDKLVNYDGTNPWTNGTLTTTIINSSYGSGNPYFSYNPESWASFVNNNNVGVTVFVPGIEHYIQSINFPGSGGPTGGGTNYLQFFGPYSFGPSETLDGDIYLIGGAPQTARQTVYNIKNNIIIPHPFDPIGWLDQPISNQTVSNTQVISGWTFDIIPVSGVKIYIDNNFVADATIGLSRPDIPAVYPNAPANSGFLYNLDTTAYPNGLHDLRVDVQTSDSKIAQLNQSQINFNNTNNAPAGTFDLASCSLLEGWTCDADDYSAFLDIHFYKDGPAGTGTFIGSTTANITREPAVGSSCGGNPNHGFSFTTPASVKDGNSHTLYALAINIPPGTNPQLNGSPKTILCSAPTPTPTPTPSPSPTPPPKLGDINGDGSVNVVDFSIMLSKWGTADTGADLNKDGTVNVVDFSILLSNWGT